MEDTIAAIATNNMGQGAINIIRLSGPDAINIITKIFSNKHISSAKSHTIHYGYIKNQNGNRIDEVLVMLMRAPKTYTTEDVVEINCHGGMITTNKILELLLISGARLAEPGEFTKRAFLNGRINLLEAESVSDLIEAQNENASKLALNGISGNVTNLIRLLREEMVSLISNIEVNIDYPEYEDELVITHQNILPKLNDIQEKLQKIIKESEASKVIKNGLDVALIGRPNVGKSSLLNALLEEQKAIVTNISGTTRDTVEGKINLNGIILNIIDTAGIRTTSDIVEKIGVDKSKQLIDKADIVILVLNNNEKLTKEDQELLEQIQKKQHIIFINKNDLPSKINKEIINMPNTVMGNTVTPNGIIPLKEKIISKFKLDEINTKDMNFLSNVRQISLAKKALKNIIETKQQIVDNIPIDMLETELKSAWTNLGLIIGESYEEELIDNIFKKFCLGK